MIRIIASSVDSLLAKKSFAAHSAYFDVEHHSEGFALVLRSNDKHVIGLTNAPSQAEYVFNRTDGKPVRFTVAVSDSRADLQRAADELICFYSSKESLSVRHSRLGAHALAVVPIAISVFGIYSRLHIRSSGKPTGWRVGSWKALGATKAAMKVRKAVAADVHFQRLSDAACAAVGQPVPPEMVQIIARVMALVNAPARHFAA